MSAQLIIKLGGSLERSQTLDQWLFELGRSAGGKIVLVPGGGARADRVRAQQCDEGFDDSVAHTLALRAMDQSGLQMIARGNAMLAQRNEAQCYAAARDPAEIRALCDSGAMPVWLPASWADAQPSIPRNWNVTSDSLALWLAQHLGVSGVILVKSAPVGRGVMHVTEAAMRGWVDAAFADFMRVIDTSVSLIESGSSATIRSLLAGEIAQVLRLIRPPGAQ